jgi:2-aminoethylphosphonate-pyruvate transaminase
VEDDAPYLLLTPGPLTTSPEVKRAMLRDVSTWDDDYNEVVQAVRRQLVGLAGGGDDLTAILMQGSGTFAVEATLGSVVPRYGKLLVVSNGAYGARMAQIADRLRIAYTELASAETEPCDPSRIDAALAADPGISHVALVHCETTTGLLNDAAAAGQVVRGHGRSLIVDAMSSFGGIPMTSAELGADYLISSANKCIQGVPGFAFVIARRDAIESTAGYARSLSLDLYDQWQEMESHGGKWRFTSPTHVVLAFAQALDELAAEGGVAARHQRYSENQRRLVDGMERLGLRALLPRLLQSPIITSFLYPSADFDFRGFYLAMKRRGFVLYPGKISQTDTFRIGTIGHVFPADIDRLLAAVDETLHEQRIARAATRA